jgi:hypothetical protein
MQGWGVNVPAAAEVAEATCGLANDIHIPNPGTFSGLTSVTTPPAPVAVTWVPDAAKVAGVVPIEQLSDAPLQTKSGIRNSPP